MARYAQITALGFSDNLPYEKVGKNEPICIADEVPFDIPESWEWVRLQNICNIVSARRVHQSDWKSSGIPFYRAREIGVLADKGKVDNDLFVSEELYNDFAKSGVPHPGDLMVTAVGTLGKVYVVQPQDRFYYKDASVICLENFGRIIPEYLQLVMMSPYMTSLIKSKSTGTTVGTITIVCAKQYLIPIPPLNEQRKIVKRLGNLKLLIEIYAEEESALSKLTTQFPEILKKSILQYAVQGKLAPQDPADEPASVLLERIRTEKEKLIKAGKIKRDKHESVIFRRDNSYYEISGKNEVCIDDQIPFDVPENWEWTRTGSLFQVNPRNRLPDDLDVGFMPMPLLSDGFGNHHDFQIRKWKEIKTGFTHFADGDIVIAKITPCFQNRKSAVISGLPNGFGAGTTELHVLRDHTKKLFMPYFLLIYKTHAFIENGMKNFSGTAGQQRIGKELISDYLIPIPPLEEQKRIVSAVESIFKKLDNLLD